MNEQIDVVDVDEHYDDMSQENKNIVGQLKQIIFEGRTSDGIKNLKHDINILHRESKGELGNKKQWKVKHLEEKYRVRRNKYSD